MCKFTFFVVFAVLAQIVIGEDQDALETKLIVIKSAWKDSVKAWEKHVNTFFDIAVLRSLNNSGTLGDSEDITCNLAKTGNKLIVSLKAIYNSIKMGAEPVTRDNSVFSIDDRELHKNWTNLVRITHKLEERCVSANVPTCEKIIPATKVNLDSRVVEIWMNIFRMLIEAVHTTDMTTNHAFLTIGGIVSDTALLLVDSSFTALHAARSELFNGNQSGNTSLLTIAAQRKLALTSTSLIHYIFSLLQSTAAARHSCGPSIMTDMKEIDMGEVDTVNGLTSTFEFAFKHIFKFLDNENITSRDQFVNELNEIMGKAYDVGTGVIAYMEPGGSADLDCSAYKGYEKLPVLVDAIADAIFATGSKDTSGAGNVVKEKKKATLYIVDDIALKFYYGIAKIVEKTDPSFASKINEYYYGNATAIQQKAWGSIFDAAGLLIPFKKNEASSEDTRAAIETVYTQARTGLRIEISQRGDLMRAGRLLTCLKSAKVYVPYQTLLPPK